MNAPSDELAPVGWVCTRNDLAEIVFEHEERPTAVRAIRESDDLWRVEMTEHAGEAESTRTVGYACTRDRALDALSTSMSAMNRVADRTGVVGTMMASTLALYDDAGVRGVTPEWRAADRPFERQVSTETPRKPWRRADDAPADDRAADADAPGDESREGEDGSDTDGGEDGPDTGGGEDGIDTDGGDGADADAAAPDEDDDAAGSDERRSAPSESPESTDQEPDDGT